MGPGVRRDDSEGPTSTAAKGFKLSKIYSLKPRQEPPVARANDDAVNSSIGRRCCCPSSPADVRRPRNQSGDVAMSKRIAFLTAAAFGALALTATIVAPVSAQEKTVMVG